VKQLSWPTVGLIAVLGAVSIGLASLTSWGSGEILGLVGILAGIGGGAAVAGGVSGRVEELQTETSAQSAQLHNIERRVNGELDGRIASAVDKGNTDLLHVLREKGVIQ
jgi:uncharacterized protein HemX